MYKRQVDAIIESAFNEPLVAPEVILPAPGSVLAGSEVGFEWEDIGADEYVITAGTTEGSRDLFGARVVGRTRQTVRNLPTDGSPVYVSILARARGQEVVSSIKFTSLNANALVSEIVFPVQGSVLTGSQMRFEWEDVGADEYVISAGTVEGARDIFAARVVGRATQTVRGLPTDGSDVYVTVLSRFASGEFETSTKYRSLNDQSLFSGIVFPEAGIELTGSQVRFEWDDVGADEYVISAGTVEGARDIFAARVVGRTTQTVRGLPTDGSAVYVTILSRFGADEFETSTKYRSLNDQTLFSDVVFPKVGSVLIGSQVRFEWEDVGADEYVISAGTEEGARDIFAARVVGRTAQTVRDLPADGSLVYVTILARFGADEFETSTKFTSGSE